MQRVNPSINKKNSLKYNQLLVMYNSDGTYHFQLIHMFEGVGA